MSALTGRIANLVRRELTGHLDFFVAAQVADHVAERIEAELQLTEERDRIALLDMPLIRRRWVSAWSEVDR